MNSIEEVIRLQYLNVISDAETKVGTRLDRFRDAEFSFNNSTKLTGQKPNFFWLSDLTAKPYWELMELPEEVRQILAWTESQYHEIHSEFQDNENNINWQRGRTGYFGEQDNWFRHDLVSHGGKINQHIPEKFPTLFKTLNTLRKQDYLSGTYFSKMIPGCQLLEHCGAFNMALRLHLGIYIPQKGCKLVVDKIEKSWENGKWLCFDDCFPHAAYNSSFENRWILLIRFLHPELSEKERKAFYVIEENPLFWDTYDLFKKHYSPHSG